MPKRRRNIEISESRTIRAARALRSTFTDVQINDPGGTLPLLRDKVVNIRIANNELIMEETDGDRTYVRL